MSKNKIYCSYSSSDREIVLNTVNVLKNKGLDVWFDQLDISLGERWDESVERALDESNIVLVFMSKASLESSNVMDEFSIAIVEGKQIMPILIENCELPMRLKRFQYVDFANNYEAGMNQLLQALNASDSEFVSPINEKVTISNEQFNDGEFEATEDVVDNNINYNVFISYNHGDARTAYKIKEVLTDSGIDVTIDEDSMKLGQEIKSFISESIQKADAVLTLISNRSLKSGWVGVETFDTMFAEEQSGKRKLIGCVLDSDFYNYDYTINTIDGLDEEIESRKKVMIRQLEKDVSVTDISSEIDRLRKLRQNFPETMKRLRDFKCIDVSDEEIINHSMDKFVKQLKRPKVI